jgi:PHD/YefM family antitoxin component YafN of YafNO toxin-antitoxin module
MEEKMTFADQHRFIAAQKAKIHTQREFIRLLERQREDAEIVQMEKEILDSMMRTLNSASSHLRSIMERASQVQKRRSFRETIDHAFRLNFHEQARQPQLATLFHGFFTGPGVPTNECCLKSQRA